MWHASLLGRAAPARQIASFLALREAQRPIERGGEARLDLAALDAPAQEIRPQEFAERGDVFGEAAGAAQLAGERAKRIVRHVGDGLGNVRDRTSAAVGVVGM